MLRVFGLWLLYATVGGVVAAMTLLGAGGDIGGDTKDSPTRDRTKVVAAGSGAMFIMAAAGAWMLTAPDVVKLWPTVMIAAGVPAGVILTIWSWVLIARDLQRGGAK